MMGILVIVIALQERFVFAKEPKIHQRFAGGCAYCVLYCPAHCRNVRRSNRT